jgi:hypothetical protein
MIPEPQRTYVLELLKALGPAGDEFVVAGAQAMKLLSMAQGQLKILILCWTLLDYEVKSWH